MLSVIRARFFAPSMIGALMLEGIVVLTWAHGTKPPPNIDAALAYPYHYRPSFDECISKAETSMYGMVDCSKAELACQDVRLNKAYKALMARRPLKGRAKPKSDENILMQYRDTHCPAGPRDEDSPVGEYESCVLTKTAEQATYREAALDNL